MRIKAKFAMFMATCTLLLLFLSLPAFARSANSPQDQGTTQTQSVQTQAVQKGKSQKVQPGPGKEVGKEKDQFIRYAGVAVQYFASIIVVDDEQVEGQQQDFLARARPTLESYVVKGRVSG